MLRPLVSAIVVTRGRPKAAARCLRSLALNRYRPLQVVILDNGSESERTALADAIANLDVHVKHLACAPTGFGALRREAFAAADGEILVSIDDDCVAADDAIERIVAAFRAHPEAGIVGGNLRNIGFEGPDRLKGRGKLGTNGRYEPVEDPADATVFGSANQSIRRESYDATDGYDPFFVDGMEEADLALQVRRAGGRLRYAPDVKIEHHHVPSRYRRRWQNLERMRLYLYFKHLGGPTPAFLIRECGLLIGDIFRTLASIPARQKMYGDALPIRAIGAALFEIFKLKLARAEIPRLWWLARR